MNIEQLLQPIIDRLQSAGSVKTVYGEPIQVKGKTIIPVAKVAYGFGACLGTSKKGGSGEDSEGGSGGGGGIAVRPAGVLEITDEGTRFIPIGEARKLMGVLLIGFFLGVLIAGRSSRR